MTIDFETRSEADLRDVGTFAYSEHPSTEVICMAAKRDDDHTTMLWLPPKFAALLPEDHGLPLIGDMRNIFDGVTEIEAHNAIFEYAIWQNVCVPKYGWPAIPPDIMRDSMALASTYTLPRTLAAAGEALSLGIQKDVEGRKLMLKMCKPGKKGWHMNPKDLTRLCQYCLRDVEAERGLSAALGHNLPNLKERKIWAATMRMNARGIQIDTSLVDATYRVVKAYESDMLNQMATLTSGVVKSPKQVAAFARWVNAVQGAPILASADKAAVAKALERKDLKPDVRMALEIRKGLGKSSTAKYEAFKNMVCKDGRLRNNLVYHGASTGRFAGTGVQLQNLPRPHKGFSAEDTLPVLSTGELQYASILLNDIMQEASSALRSCIIAKDGYDLVVADYSSIEARNVLWLAGETEAVQMFRDGGDIYCSMASYLYNKPVSKENAAERFIGKSIILGCGYGMGAQKFRLTCANQGVHVEETLAEQAVKAYREKYVGVPRLWWGLEKAAKNAVKKPGQKFATTENIVWLFKGRYLRCALPSGRCLWYFDPAILYGERGEQLTYMGVNSYTKQWERLSTFGGKLCENVISAISRDIMVEAMLRLEAEGYDIIMTVHDEIISEAPEGFGSVEEYVEIMTAPLDWAPGCPIAAEGWRAKRYKK